MKAQTGIILAVLAILVFGGLGLYGINKFSVTSEQQAMPKSDTGKTITGEENFCANNPALDLELRSLDVLAVSASYVNATVYIKNLDNGVVTEQSVVSANGGFDSFSNALQCGNAKGYEIIVKTTQDGINGAEKITIKPSELFSTPVQKTMKVTEFSLAKVKAYDNANKQSMGQSGTGYQVLPATFNETGSGLVTIGADGYLDIEFTLAPNVANKAMGMKSIVCINYADESNVDDWDSNSIDLSLDGEKLSEATLVANDAMALSGYEKCYAMPHPIGMGNNGEYKSVSTIKFYITSQAGVNPDFDPVLRIVSLGDYQSNKDTSVILNGVASQDNSARTFIGSATAGTITIPVV